MSSPECCRNGDLDRRRFLLLAAAGLTAAGCETVGTGGAAGGAGHVIDAGLASQVAAGGINTTHKDQGFFLIRQNGAVVAISSYCTHRRCQIDPQPDRSFECPCHGSRFDPAGKVVQGPAVRNLPVFPTTVNAQGHVLVTVSA